MGGEALRVLLGHPEVEVAWVTSRRPGPVSAVHPNPCGRDLEFVDLESVPIPDFVFLALPTAGNMGAIPEVPGRYEFTADLGMAGGWSIIVTFDPGRQVQFNVNAS